MCASAVIVSAAPLNPCVAPWSQAAKRHGGRKDKMLERGREGRGDGERKGRGSGEVGGGERGPG